MKTNIKLILSSMLICMVFFADAQTLTLPSEKNKKILFKAEVSRLWVDNAIWSRQAILCLTDRLPGAQESLYRLLVNQEDMGRMFTKFYGEAAGNEFCELISSNTSLTVSIIRNKSSNSTKDLETARMRMNYNVRKIAEYLASINPNWTKEELEYLFMLQLRLFENQLQHRLNENYTADIENFDKIIAETYVMADILSEGIIKQFPEKFE
jgi:hypothetical protein